MKIEKKLENGKIFVVFAFFVGNCEQIFLEKMDERDVSCERKIYTTCQLPPGEAFGEMFLIYSFITIERPSFCR